MTGFNSHVVKITGHVDSYPEIRGHARISKMYGNGKSTRAQSLDGFSSASPVSSYFMMLL